MHRVAREGARCAPARKSFLWEGLRTRKRLLAVVLCVGLSSGRSAAQAEPGMVWHEVVPGDTLSMLVQDLLESQHTWQALAELNQLRNPHRLRPGQRLRIPGGWLKPRAVAVKVVSVSGEANTEGRRLQVGDSIAEGGQVQTGTDAVVTLELPDGSQLRLAPASLIRLERLRRYHEETVVDALIRLERGRVEALAQPGRTRPMLIRSPYATAAVRGTEFRVGALDDLATTEVLSGAVAWKGATNPSQVERGFGATADGQGRVSEPLALLPAPQLQGLAPLLESPSARLAFPAIAGARAYRIEIAADPGFGRPLSEVVSEQPVVVLDSSRDGEFHLRIRGIAESRLEGFDARAVVQVRARPLAPEPLRPADRVVLFEPSAIVSWKPVAAASGYRLQTATDPGFGSEFREQDLAADHTQHEIAGRSPGMIFWRLASIDANGRRGPFGPARGIEWRGTPAAPAARLDDRTVELSWHAPSGHESRLELSGLGLDSGDVALTPLANGIDDRRRVLLGPLPPGTGRARVRLIAPDGIATPFSAPVEWRVTDPLRDSTGRPVGAGAGGLVGSQDR